MTKQRLFLRIGVVALLATLVLSMALEFFNVDLLPEELRRWGQDSEEFSGLALFFGRVFKFLSVAAYVASLIGVYFYRRWAAVLLLVITVVFSFGLLMGPTVEPGLTAFVGVWDSMLTGAVLALAFFTDALEPGQD